jgi:tetraacyldisaccharide 4'-kinase
LSVLSAAYGRVARLRRSWYARHPDARRRLDRPVVSVGNLVVGGSGKTPLVAAIARLLLAAGERPAILSRGYGRRRVVDGVLVVSDGTRVLQPVTCSGDEPLMLARQLPGVPVLVAPDRFLAGRVAERQLDATVLLLDDGFQHLQLARDVDLLLVDAADLAEPVLPSGRLREPLDAASAADAVLVAGDPAQAAAVAGWLGLSRSFAVVPRYGTLRIVPGGEVMSGRPRVFATSGIARPGRFSDALRAEGWDVAGEMRFADHYWYTRRDLDRIHGAARRVGAEVVVTTEKDAVRMEGLLAAGDMPWTYLPMEVAIAPPLEFSSWLQDAL